MSPRHVAVFVLLASAVMTGCGSDGDPSNVEDSGIEDVTTDVLDDADGRTDDDAGADAGHDTADDVADARRDGESDAADDSTDAGGDIKPPEFVGFSPVPYVWAASGEVTFQFSEPMDTASFQSALSLSAGGVSEALIPVPNEDQTEFTVTFPDRDGPYVLRISEAATDLAGNALQAGLEIDSSASVIEEVEPLVPGVNADDLESVQVFVTQDGERIVWFTVYESDVPVTYLQRDGEVTPERIGTTAQANVDRMEVLADDEGRTWLVWQERPGAEKDGGVGSTLHARGLSATEPVWNLPLPAGQGVASFDAVATERLDGLGGPAIEVFATLTNGVDTVLKDYRFTGSAWEPGADFPLGQVLSQICGREFNCEPVRGYITGSAFLPVMNTTGRWVAAVMPAEVLGVERAALVVFAEDADSGRWRPFGQALGQLSGSLIFSVEMTGPGAVPTVAWLERTDERYGAFVARFNMVAGEWEVVDQELAQTETGELIDLEMQNTGAGAVLHYLERNGSLTFRRSVDAWSGAPVFDDIAIADSVIGGLSVVRYPDDTTEVLIPTRISDEVFLKVQQVVDTTRALEPVTDLAEELGWRRTNRCQLAEFRPADASMLSETGCYRRVSQQIVISDAIPYELNSILYSDQLQKRRFLILPEGGFLEVVDPTDPLAPLEVPVGTVVMKEFWLGHPEDPRAVIVETRFLVRTSETAWDTWSYRWNEEQTDAILMVDRTVTATLTAPAGLRPTQPVNYVFPSRTGVGGCLRCHTEGNGFLLGPRLANLQRNVDYGNGTWPQLQALVQAGVLKGISDWESVPALVNPTHSGADATERMLSYFQGNCVHCHGPGGERADLPLGPAFAPISELSVCDLAGDPLPVGPANVVNLVRSGLYRRDQAAAGEGAMPPLGRDHPDPVNRDVFMAWYGTQSFLESDAEQDCPPD